MKNLVKTNRIVPLKDLKVIVENGYHYIKTAFYDERVRLFRRFTVTNKPSIVRFDLYDNAEMLNLALLMEDHYLVENTSRSITEHFCKGGDIFSQIDILGRLQNRNTLRWAVMPYIYALSQMVR